MKRPNFATAAFFDDVRHEVSGKVTYIGRYSRQYLVRRFPFTINTLHVEVTFGTDRNEPDFASEIWVYTPESNEPLVSQLGAPPENYENTLPKDAEVLQSVHGLTLADIEVSAPGEIKLEVHTKSGNIIPAGRLFINVLPAPSPRNWHLDSLNAIIGHFHALGSTESGIFEKSAIALLRQIVANTQADKRDPQKECRIPLSPTKCLVLLSSEVKDLEKRLRIDESSDAVELVEDVGFVVTFSDEKPDPREFSYSIS